jgi:hypothetical protein
MRAADLRADLLCRLADEAVLGLEPNQDDPVRTLIGERHRLYHLFEACDLEHKEELQAEYHNQLDDLDQKIAAATAKSRTGLLLQLRLLNEESFRNKNRGPLIDAVFRGICDLIPLSRKGSGRAAQP